MKLLAAILLAPSLAFAGGTAVGEQNAVSAATAGAGAARADDPGAAWHDPAALADDGGMRVGLSLAFARPSVEAQTSDGSFDATSWATPPHLDASFARDRWAAGIALGVPFGGGVTWPQTWPGANETVRTDLQVFRAAPFFAYRFGALRVAAGVHFDQGRLQLQRGLDFIDTQGDVKLDLSGHGFGADASLYYQARPDLGLGLAYRGRTHLALGGNANFTAPDAFSEKTPDQTATTAMTLPDQLVLGARWTRGALALLADLEYTAWHVNQATVIDFANPSTPQAMQDNRWHDTLAVRLGGELVRGVLTLRGGAYFDPSPVPADHLSPTAPDGTRLGLTAGASYRLSPAWSADAFAEGMALLRRATTSADTMPASYGGTALVLGAGVRWSH
jgi:long-chain fatty acid transport protein